MHCRKKSMVATGNVMMNFGSMSVTVQTLILRLTLKSISVESAASLSWRREQHIAPKRQLPPTMLHSVTIQNPVSQYRS